MTRFAVAVFLSTFLVFQVQPLVSKHILPWYGGTPSVWTSCLLFFQLLLLAGYAYAHLIISKLRHRWQAVLHVVILLLAASVSILPDSSWKPEGAQAPLIHDRHGRHVKTLIDSRLTPGRHRAIWRGRDELGRPVPSGIYLYSLKSSEHTDARKMTLLR